MFRNWRHDLESALSTWLSFMRYGQLESKVIQVNGLTLTGPRARHVKEPKEPWNRGMSSPEGLSMENVFISDKVTGTVRSDSSSLDIHYAPAEHDVLLPVPSHYLNLSQPVAE